MLDSNYVWPWKCGQVARSPITLFLGSWTSQTRVPLPAKLLWPAPVEIKPKLEIGRAVWLFQNHTKVQNWVVKNRIFTKNSYWAICSLKEAKMYIKRRALFFSALSIFMIAKMNKIKSVKLTKNLVLKFEIPQSNWVNRHGAVKALTFWAKLQTWSDGRLILIHRPTRKRKQLVSRFKSRSKLRHFLQPNIKSTSSSCHHARSDAFSLWNDYAIKMAA